MSERQTGRANETVGMNVYEAVLLGAAIGASFAHALGHGGMDSAAVFITGFCMSMSLRRRPLSGAKP